VTVQLKAQLRSRQVTTRRVVQLGPRESLQLRSCRHQFWGGHSFRHGTAQKQRLQDVALELNHTEDRSPISAGMKPSATRATAPSAIPT
jgi:hypothetical protein